MKNAICHLCAGLCAGYVRGCEHAHRQNDSPERHWKLGGGRWEVEVGEIQVEVQVKVVVEVTVEVEVEAEVEVKVEVEVEAKVKHQ